MNRLRKPTLHYHSLQSASKPVFWIIYLGLFAKTTPFPTQPHTPERLQQKTEGHSSFLQLVILVNSLSLKIIRKKWAEGFFLRVWTWQVSLWFADRGNVFLTLPAQKLSIQVKKQTLLPANSCRGVVPCCIMQKHLDIPGSPWTRARHSAMLFTVRAPSS